MTGWCLADSGQNFFQGIFGAYGEKCSRPAPELLAARGRTAQDSRAVIRCAARGRWFPSRASGGRVHRDPRNGLPQAQQKAQKSGKHLPNTVFQLPWRARTQQFAQDQAQVERADMDQLPLQNVFVSAQMATPHAARLVAVRETALDQLAAPPQ